MKGAQTASRGDLARIALFAVAYFGVTSLTIGWSRYGGGLALVWFGSAVAAVMLLGLPRAHWGRALVAIMGASAVATSLFGFGPRMALPLALINALEAWLVARLLLASRPQRDWLDNVSGLATLVAAGGIVAPGLAAIPGGFAASLAAPGAWYRHGTEWWMAHGLGTLIGFPMAYLAAAGGRKVLAAGWTGARAGELAGHLLVIAAFSWLALGQSRLPLLFLPIMPLLLAAFRCGREGATLGTLVIAAFALVFDHHQSMIASLGLTHGEEVLFLQFYLAILSLLALPVSVALRQHQLLLDELEERKALELLIADHSDDALLNLDENGLVRYASPAGARLSGTEELVGEPLGLFFDPLDEGLVRDALARAAASPGETGILERAVLRGDEQLWLEAKLRAVAPVCAHGGRPGALQGFAVTIRDVTARKQTELDAIEAAETDPLTGLPNRRAFLGQLERVLAHAEQRPFALAILDLDHFKAINDSHGHLAGDAVLGEVSAVMRRMSSPSRYFARLGGEEFALIGRQREFADAERLCERLRAETAALRFTAPDGSRFRVTASIGLARIAEPAGVGQALQAADTLLYAAKDGGRNRVETALSSAPRPAIRRVA